MMMADHPLRPGPDAAEPSLGGSSQSGPAASRYGSACGFLRLRAKIRIRQRDVRSCRRLPRYFADGSSARERSALLRVWNQTADAELPGVEEMQRDIGFETAIQEAGLESLPAVKIPSCRTRSSRASRNMICAPA